MAAVDSQPSTGGPVLRPGEQICPDPSAHEHPHGSDLPDKAADAALHSHPERVGEVRTENPLDPEHKLSSAGAATSLKYARAHELPGYPIIGVDRNNHPLSAANLAHKNQKPFEHWKPEASTHASKAALLAHDYKSAPAWQPTPSQAGSKAAMAAHGGAGREWWQPEPTKAGNAAAGSAMRNKNLSPKAYGGATDNDKMNALLAATAVHGRKSVDAPAPPANYPDSHNAQRNSLYAATSADANRLGSRAMEASRVQNLSKNVTPKMFTEHPPIAWEVEDKNHDAALQASAISMAKQMYAVQKVNDDGTITVNDAETASRSATNNRSSVGSDIHQQALQYISLQDAAQKLAAERLSKIQHPDETAAFRDWYGYPQQKPRSRMSMRKSGPGRRAASADSWEEENSSDDEYQASRIRSRQRQLNDQVAQVDAQKRDEDRRKLMAAAERRVHAQMLSMDKKVFDDTGKMSQAMVEDWDAKARARAAAASEARMLNHGKVSIGGGKWMDQSAIDAIAAARVKPTLDEINAKAEKQRELDEEQREEREMQRQQTMEEKARVADEKAEQKRIKREEKDEAKTRKWEEKRLAREEKDAEKARRAEEKRIQKEEKRRSKTDAGVAGTAAANVAVVEHERPVTAGTVSTVDSTAEDHETASSVHDAPVTAHQPASKEESAVLPEIRPSTPLAVEPTGVLAAEPLATAVPAPTTPPASSKHDGDIVRPSIENDTPTKSPSKSRLGSVLNKLKPKSKSKEPGSFSTTKDGKKLHKSTAVAAAPAAETALPQHNAPESSPELPDSDDELYAEASREPAVGPAAVVSATPAVAVAQEEPVRGRTSSRKSSLASADFEEARDELVAPAPEPAFTSAGSQSPNRGSKFHEEV